MKRQRPFAWDKAQAAKKRRTQAPILVRTTRVARASKTEAKVNDIAVATYQVNTTGSFTLLTFPVPGADFNQRIGRKILLKSVYIRGEAHTEPSLAVIDPLQGVPQLARMIIFADLQPNGAAPAVTDLLNTASPASHLNLNNRDRFKVYCDETYVFDPYRFSTTATQSVASTVNQIKEVKRYKKINLEMVFNAGTAGTIADVTSGALYMFWIGSVAAGTGDVNAILSTRVRYTDK